MYVHTCEWDIRPGFDGVKIKFYYIIIKHIVDKKSDKFVNTMSEKKAMWTLKPQKLMRANIDSCMSMVTS